MTRFLTLAAFALTACAPNGELVQGPDEMGPDLVLRQGDGNLTGLYTGEQGSVWFQSRFLTDDVLDMTVELNGLTLTQVLDLDNGVAEYDGFTSHDGTETMMSLDDRALLKAFTARLDGVVGEELSDELVQVRRYASHWVEVPAGMDMRYQALTNIEHSMSACAYVNDWARGTHDGWFEDNWDDDTTLDGIYLSMHGACAGSGGLDEQATLWWVNGAWSCLGSEPDHSTSVEYAYGDCFGRCGGGCGSDTVFTWSCVDHDVCNRFGHSWSASIPPGHCSDEFAAAGIELATEPNCL
ncbi:MAG: hypothetical protein EP330_04210 [Deltaproteobacteria bacterium]|nr:MAG: hypothetical protein EP330_04210 [Deltaproteobacteria bacterium]